MRIINGRSRFEEFKEHMVLWGVTVLTLLIAFIPTWIYLLARLSFNPDSALAEILLFGISLYFMGALQMVFLVIAGIFIFAIWE